MKLAFVASIALAAGCASRELPVDGALDPKGPVAPLPPTSRVLATDFDPLHWSAPSSSAAPSSAPSQVSPAPSGSTGPAPAPPEHHHHGS